MAKPVIWKDPAVEKVAISGPTLAFMLQDFSFSQEDCDGIIFGHVERRSIVNLQDDEEQVTREEVTAMVTGYCCSGTLFSFYDATGRINQKKLANLIGERAKKGGDPVIGWFIGRRSSPLRPSMREMSVTSHLRSLVFQSRTLSSETRSGRQGSAGGESTHKGGALSMSGRADVSLQSFKKFAQDESTSKDVPVTKEDRVLGRVTRTNSGTRASSSSNVGVKASASSSGGSANIVHNLCSGEVDLGGPNMAHSVEVKTVQEREYIMSGSGYSPSTPSFPAVPALGIPQSSPCLFLLLSESNAQNEVQTHEYRAFQYVRKSDQMGNFESRTITIINVGPGCHGLYNVFTPFSNLPWIPSTAQMEEGGDEVDSLKALSSFRKESAKLSVGPSQVATSRKQEEILSNLDMEGHSWGRLSNLIVESGHAGISNMEDLYTGMLMKLEILAKEVSENAKAVVEQESINAKLRAAAMGSDYI